jgi:hypothetical protein
MQIPACSALVLHCNAGPACPHWPLLSKTSMHSPPPSEQISLQVAVPLEKFISQTLALSTQIAFTPGSPW